MKFKVKFVPDTFRNGVELHLEALDDGAGVAEPGRVVRQQRGELPRHLLPLRHARDQLLKEGKRESRKSGVKKKQLGITYAPLRRVGGMDGGDGIYDVCSE